MSKVKKNVTVQAPVDVVYGVWHNFENFPNFMSNIEEVRVVGEGRSHWKAKGPLGSTAEWDAEVTLDEPNQTIGWRSIEGERNVKTAGRVNFRGAGGATYIEVTIEYDAPGGAIGDVVTKIFANPDRQVDEDLHRFKEIVEEDVRLGSPGGSGATGSAEPLGSSLGNNSERDLDAISDANSGVAPTAVDDPAER